MPKLPYTQFYVADWLSDTAPLSAQARGVWIDLICFLWRAEPRGRLSYPREVWLRILRLDDLVFDVVLEELTAFRICNITCNDLVTIESRRIVREEKKRENNRMRVEKWRHNKDGNASVTIQRTDLLSSSNGENQKQKHIQKQKQKQNQSGSALHAAVQTDRTTKGFESMSDGLKEVIGKLAVQPDS